MSVLITRKLFLKFLINIPIFYFGCSSLSSNKKKHFFASGIEENGEYFIYVQNQSSQEYFKQKIPFKVHSIIQSPYSKNHLIAIEKRGPRFVVYDFINHQLLQLYTLPEKREFIGHGIVNPNSKELIITTRKVTKKVYYRKDPNSYDTSDLYSGVQNNGLLTYFKFKNKKITRIREIYSGGAEPHQITMSHDLKSFWVANGVDFVDETLNSRLACLSQIDANTGKSISMYEFNPRIDGHLADLGHLAISKDNTIVLGSYVLPQGEDPSRVGGRMVSFSLKDKFKIYKGLNMPTKDEAFNISYIAKENIFLAVCPGESKLFSIDAKSLKVLKFKQLETGTDPGGIIETAKVGEFLILTNKGGKIINSRLQILKEFKIPNNYFPGPHLKLLMV